MKDTIIKKLIQAEEKRQEKMITLIASENFVSDDVMEALGSKLTNKYSEGYPGKRYYGGNEVVDQIEEECKARALSLFDLSSKKWSVNAQPLSGSPANLAVYMALVPVANPATGQEQGKIMGMTLEHGGHLTHGHRVSATGKLWKQIGYGVNAETETLDYEDLMKKAMEEKPHLIVAGFTAYPRAINFKKFREIADACGAYLMVDMSHFAGLVAGKAYPSPFKYADVVTTTVHKTLRGPRAALIFSLKGKTKTDAKGKEVSISDLIDRAIFPGLQGGPHVNQIAAVAVALKEASTPAFQKYAAQVVKNAETLSNELKNRGWRIVSGGTDSHLILVDVWMDGKGGSQGQKSISGAEASNRLEKEGIIVNKNTIPGETRSAFDPSGIRLGTAAETTRGLKEKDFKKIAERIDEILRRA